MFYLTLLAVSVSMFFKDGLGTLLVISESRGRKRLAGGLDALQDLVVVITYNLSISGIQKNGYNSHAFQILAVMMVTSFFGTQYWTEFGDRMTDVSKQSPWIVRKVEPWLTPILGSWQRRYSTLRRWISSRSSATPPPSAK
jgi:hypothetical protein